MTDDALARRVAPAPKTIRPKVSGEDWLMRLMLLIIGLYLFFTVLLPLAVLLSKSFQGKDGSFIGLSNYLAYVTDGSLSVSIYNSLFVASISALIAVGFGFMFAYALTRSCMPFKGLFKAIALAPLLAPSLLPAISLVYLFGNQGILKSWLFGESIYGPIGIVMGEVFYVFPHTLLILIIALSASDARLYEAATVLRASKLRTFFTVTLPGARYGLISAFFVSFTLVITDFGVPKVIGGQYNVLATDVYKQVVGRQDFEMGAVVGMLLLMPALVAFVIDRIVQRQQIAQISARATPYRPAPNAVFDTVSLLFCLFVSALILGILGMAAYASFVTFWPYNLDLTLNNYRFDLMDGGGWAAYWNSLELAFLTATIGTAVIFSGAYLVEKSRGFGWARSGFQALAMAPMAVPGLVLGLAYVFFFNAPGNPLNGLYHTMAILVICTITHFYTVAHLTAVTALKQIDPEFEAVSASLKAPFYRTFFRVTAPVSSPAILEISIYLFVNAMTTVSAVVFLYAPDTSLASVAVLNMDDAGDIAPAAAMAMMIVYTSATVRLVHAGLTRWLTARSQAWRR